MNGRKWYDYDGVGYDIDGDQTNEPNDAKKSETEYVGALYSDSEESSSDDQQITNETTEEVAKEEANKAKESERNSTYTKMFSNVFYTVWDGLLGEHQIEKFKDLERQKLHDAVKDIPGFGDAVKPVNAYLEKNDVPLAEEATEIFIEQSQLYRKASEIGNSDGRLDPSDIRMDAHLESEVSKAFKENKDSDGAFIHAAVSVFKHLSIFSDTMNYHEEADYFFEREQRKSRTFGYKLTKGQDE